MTFIGYLVTSWLSDNPVLNEKKKIDYSCLLLTTHPSVAQTFKPNKLVLDKMKILHVINICYRMAC